MDTALKAIGENRVGGYLIMWGSPDQRDLQGEFFTPNTDLALDWFNERPVLYQHGFDAALKTSRIGTIDTLKVDSVGVWAEAQLELRNRYVAEVLKLIEDGTIGWSSGSMSHLVIIDPEGEIKRWPLIEGSLTPTPAEPRISVRPIKHLHANPSAFKAQVDEIDPQFLKVLSAKAGQEVEIEISVTPEDEPSNSIVQENTTMDIQQIVDAVLQQLMALRPDVQLSPEEMSALAQQVSAALQPSTDSAAQSMSVPEMTAKAVELVGKELNRRAESKQAAEAVIKSAVAELMHGAIKANIGNGSSKVPAYSGEERVTAKQQEPRPAQIEMTDRRFDHLGAAEMALGAQMLANLGHVPSQSYMKAMAYKTAQAMERGDAAANDYAVKSAFPVRKPDDVMGIEWQPPVRSSVKANEVMNTGQSGFGSQWAVTLYSTNLWQAVRQDTLVYQGLLGKGLDEQEVPQGYKSDTIPLEGSDPTWYVAGQATDESSNLTGRIAATYAASKFGTGQKEVTLAKLSARMFWARELDEDSIVGIVNEANRKIQVSGTEQIEYIILNGDTATGANTNINLIDGTPASAPSAPSYLLLDGMLKLPLVTNTANSTNAAATLSEAVYLNLMPLLGTDGKYAADPNRVVFVVDNNTYFATLNLSALKTRDVFANATIENGVITAIWGVDLIRSSQMTKANTAGKISNTGGNNTTGRILLIRPDQWAARWKRQIEVFTDFDPISDTTTLVAHMRWGLGYRDNEASAVAYNVALTIA